MSIYNTNVLTTLPSVTKGKAECYLIEYNQTSTQRLWTFLYNPQTLEFDRSAKYAETQTLSAKKQDLQYGFSTGKVLTIPEIVLDSWCEGKSVLPLLDGVERLLEADIKNKRYSPPILSFVFGTRRFAPCVLSEANWSETGWLNGQPARAIMSLKLLEVPEPETRARQETRLREQRLRQAIAGGGNGIPRQPLTERQAVLASEKAVSILKANLKRFKPNVQGLIRTGAYRLLTNKQTGDVTMLDGKGNKVGVVGRFDGKNLTVTGISDLLQQNGTISN